MASITFEHRLSCPLPATALHAVLVDALVDTDKAAFWPHGLNRVCVAELRVDAPIAATYRAPGWPETHRRYRVGQVRPGEGFSYAPAGDHPFSGEIHVDCVAAPDGSSVLHWHGTYHMAPWRPERVFFRAYFEPRFFRRLEEGLRKLADAD